MIRTKLIATLGPASNSENMLKKMCRQGLDIARLNFSHGNHAEHLKRISLIRSLNQRRRHKVKIMQDLEGYRIRIGRFLKPFLLEKGDHLYITNKNIAGNKKEVSFDYKGPLRQIKNSTLIYIDDGKIILQVKTVEKQRIKVIVISGGQLKERKGINIPSLKFKFGSLTDKDRKDVRIAIDHKLEYVAQSFVSTAKDVRVLKEIVKGAHPKCKIFAKVENKAAITNINAIISESDGIIIARGDLGISVPIYQVPILQKKIIKKCLMRRKPVVVATQMLESMTDELIPTRAEATDVANAILDGATHLLLSAETATGRHPDKVIEMMRKIIGYAASYSGRSRNFSI